MTLLLSCQEIEKSYGGKYLFSDLSFGIFKDDRIGLIGPNGSGKSTLLKILAGIDYPDKGTIAKGKSVRIGYVSQQTVFKAKTVLETLIEAASKEHSSLEERETEAKILLSKLGFSAQDSLANELSGGWQKRLAIAVELIQNPDILLLDEPTNHLDLEGVIWLERFLNQSSFAFVVISHDRYFLENVVKKTMELKKSYPKGLFSVAGSYSTFLEKKEEFLSGQLQQERSIASKVRREVEWLKQNPKARTTKSSSRIQEANLLIREYQEIKTRNKDEKSAIEFSSSKKESKKLLVTTNLSKTIGGKLLFSSLNLTLSPGTRLGVAGLNGSGKTTLLRLLSGELSPDKGTIKYAEGLQIVHFDQHRTKIEKGVSLRRALAPESDTVYYKGQPLHVNSWCKRFLFSQERLDLPFESLSGGEKARVHIARLMLVPADILLLDEPTNDLDLETLEILEDNLKEFPGAIVLISHDRYFLDQVSTAIVGLGLEDEPPLFADYRQWEFFSNQKEENKKSQVKDKKEKAENRPDSSKKMSYMEKKEWEQIEEKILKAEKEIERLQKESMKGENELELHKICEILHTKQIELDQLFSRWEELERKFFK